MRSFGLIKANRDGTYTMRLPEDVATLINELAGQLDSILTDDRDELRRLFPTAYSHDPERDAGYQVLARDALIEQRRTNVARLQATSSSGHLSEDDLQAWMQVVNDIRLVLGTMLDISEDDESIDADDPRADTYQLYYLLGVVLEEIVDARASRLDD